MRLIHYTDKKFTLEPLKYDQNELFLHHKPNGLWFSIEGENDWKEWCLSEGFRLEKLKVSYEITLKKDAKVKCILSKEELLEFTHKYPNLRNPPVKCNFELDWEAIKKDYQGIVIPVYLWECRYDPETLWYNGWDCACGCIWDISCIEEFKLIEEK